MTQGVTLLVVPVERFPRCGGYFLPEQVQAPNYDVSTQNYASLASVETLQTKYLGTLDPPG